MVFRRYKPQIAQLIDFLQSPAADPRLASCQHHTFKSTTTTSTTTASESPNMQLQHFGSLISLHDLDDIQGAGDTFGSNFNSLKRSSDITGSSLWLEDEFFKLGLRPQDEITTELWRSWAISHMGPKSATFLCNIQIVKHPSHKL